MKWFKHMTDAHDGKDLTKVRIRYGADGYAIYWYCLELIAADLGASEKITFELRHDAEVIGHNLKIDSARVEEIMRFMVTLELFEQSSDTITCLKLAKYLDKKSTRNITIHKIIDSASMLSGTKPDFLGLSGLDRDTDLDRDRDTDKQKPLSGDARPPSPLREKNRITRGEAIEALRFLNEKTGKAYREVDANLKLIESILKSGVSLEDIRTVTMRKVRDWRDNPKMADYLRPSTLYRRSNFEQYLGQTIKPETDPFQGAI